MKEFAYALKLLMRWRDWTASGSPGEDGDGWDLLDLFADTVAFLNHGPPSILGARAFPLREAARMLFQTFPRREAARMLFQTDQSGTRISSPAPRASTEPEPQKGPGVPTLDRSGT